MIKLKYFLILIFCVSKFECAELPVLVHNQGANFVHDEGIVIGSDYDDRRTVDQIRRDEYIRIRKQKFKDCNTRLVKIGASMTVVGVAVMLYSYLGCHSDELCKVIRYSGMGCAFASTIPNAAFICRAFCTRVAMNDI